ncbi:MAG: DinB family protein [Candidatus Promineifilaceae bacterium]
MNTHEQRQQKMQVLREFPQKLREAVSDLSIEQLTATPLEDEWSILQNVHHCADSHINSYVRLKLILTEENPPIKPYAEPLWAQFRDANETDMSHTFLLLEGLHHRWVDTFDALTDDQWQRFGTHGNIGQITVDDLLDIYDNHCRAHLEQILRTIAAL